MADVGISNASFTPLERFHVRNGNMLVDARWTYAEVSSPAVHTLPLLFVGAALGSTTLGFVGVKTTNPTQDLHTNGDIRLGKLTQGSYRGKGKLVFGAAGITPTDYIEFTDQNNSSLSYLSIVQNNNTHMVINPNGNVGINTNTPISKFHVNGDFTVSSGSTVNFKVYANGGIRGRALDIDLLSIPDYVFKPGYKLITLWQLEKFIMENGHLPGIKSEKEYQVVGSINIGELNIQLLEKVEELTLYILQLNKRITELENQLSR